MKGVMSKKRLSEVSNSALTIAEPSAERAVPPASPPSGDPLKRVERSSAAEDCTLIQWPQCRGASEEEWDNESDSLASPRSRTRTSSNWLLWEESDAPAAGPASVERERDEEVAAPLEDDSAGLAAVAHLQREVEEWSLKAQLAKAAVSKFMKAFEAKFGRKPLKSERKKLAKDIFKQHHLVRQGFVANCDSRR